MSTPEPSTSGGGDDKESIAARLAKLDTTQVAALLGIVTYGLGVATVSFYLQDNEIPDPDLSFFKAHYIYTGIGVLGFFVLAASLVHICIAVTSRWRDLGRTLIVFIGWGLLLIWVPYAFVLHGETDSLDAHQVLLGLELGAVCIATVALGIGAYAVNGSRTRRKALSFVFALGTLGLVFFYVFLYSREIYPLIPDQFGGGKPKQARLLFSSSGASEAQQLGVRLKAGTRLSEPVTLMLASDSFYAFRAHPDGRIIQIAKDDVVGLQEDSRAPFAVDVQTLNGGKLAGLPQKNDQLVLTFSEEIDPNSLIPNWSGKLTSAFLVDEGVPGGTDELHFSRAGYKPDLVHLGVVELRPGGYERLFGDKAHPVTIELRGRLVVVTLQAGAGIAGDPKPVRRREVMAWTPSGEATDEVGNHSDTATAIEDDDDNPSRADVDF
ncbi:MAG TPA: hypothetical protein VIM28_03630 [Solirubrobacterales bacterium]